jgi:hypothetical protein
MAEAGYAVSMKGLRRPTPSTCVSSSLSKIPYGGFSPVRLQTGIPRRPSPGQRLDLYVARVRDDRVVATGHKGRHRGPRVRCCRRRSRPEALGSPAGCVVRPGHSLLWPHPSHSPPFDSLFSSPAEHCGDEWVPNLSCMSVRACHPQNPGGPDGCRLLLPRPHWSSPCSQRLDIHKPHARWFSRGQFHEAASGSLALRPARWLALHQQGLLQSSFRRPGHPEPTSTMTTRANSQLP